MTSERVIDLTSETMIDFVGIPKIHQLCRLFLEGASLTEELGVFDFRAFLVDMNKLTYQDVRSHCNFSARIQINLLLQVNLVFRRNRFLKELTYKPFEHVPSC